MPEILNIAQEINGSRRVTFVVLDQGRIIGTADIAWSDTEEPVLGNVFVLNAARKQGIGGELVKAAKVWAETSGERIWLRVAPGHLADWYARLGFRESGETGGAYLWMKWEPA